MYNKTYELSPAIIAEIELDLERGVYKSYPLLKSRLEYIKQKIVMGKYVLNSDYIISQHDIDILREQGYGEFICERFSRKAY